MDCILTIAGDEHTLLGVDLVIFHSNGTGIRGDNPPSFAARVNVTNSGDWFACVRQNMTPSNLTCSNDGTIQNEAVTVTGAVGSGTYRDTPVFQAAASCHASANKILN